ncbi:MAG: hypothetical protein NVS4B2_15350 [Chloroflexota bacterium]
MRASLTTVFLTAFVVGLVVGVAALLFGVERRCTDTTSRSASDVGDASLISTQSCFPASAALLTVVGAVGYLLVHRSTLSSGASLMLALSAGVAAFFGVIAVLAIWAIPTARQDALGRRLTVAGTLARVTRLITPQVPGEVAYEIEGRKFSAPAVSDEDLTVAVGTDVVIARLDDGVAYIEPWSSVERRI